MAEAVKQVRGLTCRLLARRLGGSPYRLWVWRRGTGPGSIHLSHHLTLADEMGLREIVMCRDRGHAGGQEKGVDVSLAWDLAQT